jgi:hypothetical protein
MHAKVYTTISSLRTKRLTLYQACLITNYVTGPCLEIGSRHAGIPPSIPLQWDHRLAAAFATRANLSSARLHYSSIFIICKVTPFTARHTTAKTTQTLNSLKVPSELITYYRANLSTTIPGLEELDLRITRNTKSRYADEGVMQHQMPHYRWPEMSSRRAPIKHKATFIQWNRHTNNRFIR